MEDLETGLLVSSVEEAGDSMGAASHWVFSKKSLNKKFICLYISLRKTGSVFVSAVSKFC